jgi:sterol desaturase/sphingolipid hydroxylase (fatty acid hydroxylase superfamily)
MRDKAPERSGVGACLLPVLYGLTLGGSVLALRAGFSELVVLAASTTVTAMFGVGAERLVAERMEWKPLRAEMADDGLHFVFGFLLGALGASAVAEVWGVWLWSDVLATVDAPWPTTWPWPLQLAVAFALAELTGYLQHRAVHGVPWLWRFHSIHHEPRRLHVIKTTRIHFLDIGTATLVNLGVLYSLGAPARIIFWVNVFTNVTALAQHGNVRWRTPRWLDALVCTPAVHQSHHGRDVELGTANYATNLPVWDHVFRTFRGPTTPTPREVGLVEDRPAKGFWATISAPFLTRA